MPSCPVAQLAEAGLLPPGFTILGAANSDWSTDDFRQHIAGELEKHATVTLATCDAVVRMLSFQSADITRRGEVSRLIGDEDEESWRIIDPVAKAWSAGQGPTQEYAGGEAPPGPSL
ncbi:MAG: hypothetical protein ACXWQZ_14310 [Ktedonobacterales bacterium]